MQKSRRPKEIAALMWNHCSGLPNRSLVAQLNRLPASWQLNSIILWGTRNEMGSLRSQQADEHLSELRLRATGVKVHTHLSPKDFWEITL